MPLRCLITMPYHAGDHFFLSMTTEFLSIKEAADRYQKAEITIRRLVRDIIKKAQHEEREHVRPSPAEIKTLKMKKKPYAYTVSSELLARAYNRAMASNPGESVAEGTEATPPTPYKKLLEQMNDELRGQLKVKDDQIRALNQALDGLSERQRETNILMKGLQEKLLPAPQEKKSWWRR